MKRQCLYLVFFLISQVTTLWGQTRNDVFDSLIVKRIEAYGLKRSGNTLFVHFDKTVYSNNENVWFTAYLEKTISRESPPDVLAVFMINNRTKAIAYQARFVMKNNIAFGNFFLPDTIPSGEYCIVSYANNFINQKPAGFFIQPVTIKNATENTLKITLNVTDSNGSFKALNQRVKLTLKATDKAVPGALVSYSMGSSDHLIVTGNTKTDENGQSEISIPANKIIPGTNFLRISASYKKESSMSYLELPLQNDKASVEFFPEGGSLVKGLGSLIGWEVKDFNGSPLQLKAILLKNNQPIDTLESNALGIGKFRLIPEQGSIYALKLYEKSLHDSLYSLPKILDKGYVMTFNHAIVDDTLSLKVSGTTQGKVFLIVHNFRQAYFTIPMLVNKSGRVIKIDLKDIPKGLAEITLLDSLRRPGAERLFFAHFNKKVTLDIKTDKQLYHPREKISVNLKLKSDSGNPINGRVSVACVESNRLDLRQQTDIERYTYLDDQLGIIPVQEGPMEDDLKGREYLENLLLIKGWRKYKWQELMETSPADTNLLITEPNFNGKVKFYGEVINKPVSVAFLKDSSLDVVSTNFVGNFILDNEMLYTAQDKGVYLYLANKSSAGYSLTLGDPYKKINDSVARHFEEPILSKRPKYIQSSYKQESGRFNNAISLKGVTIKGESSNRLYPTHANECGDYVCVFNILNCPVHRNDPGNKMPRLGQRCYLITNENELEAIVYNGCNIVKHETSSFVKGIYYSKEFYPSDYSQFSPTAPEFLSTIFWKHLTKVNTDNSVNLSFYASDITGSFKIIVQGLCTNDVVYGCKEIRVQK